MYAIEYRTGFRSNTEIGFTRPLEDLKEMARQAVASGAADAAIISDTVGVVYRYPSHSG